MTLTYDLYWSFRSPYSYFLTSRLVALEAEYDVRGNIRPVLPIAVREPEFFDAQDPLWFSYFARDTHRVAEHLGLPFRWPRPDPVTRDPATGRYAAPEDQPYIHRLTRLGVLAAEQGKGLAFLDEISRLIWGGSTDDWTAGDHIAQATARAGLDLAALDPAATQQAERLDAIIAESQVDQRAAGHYGVPLLVFDGEPFFGQDRFDLFKWRMEKAGLSKRSA